MRSASHVNNFYEALDKYHSGTVHSSNCVIWNYSSSHNWTAPRKNQTVYPRCSGAGLLAIARRIATPAQGCAFMCENRDRYPEWMDLKTLEEYSTASEHTIRRWTQLLENPLPYSQVNGTGKMYFHRDTYDKWKWSHQGKQPFDVQRFTQKMLGKLKEG